jgi:hypothetical protein
VADEETVARRRLLFWLRVPYVADAAMVVIGVWLLVDGNGVGWWVLLFAALRAVVGTISLVVIAPRMIAARSARPPDQGAAQGASTAER